MHDFPLKVSDHPVQTFPRRRHRRFEGIIAVPAELAVARLRRSSPSVRRRSGV